MRPEAKNSVCIVYRATNKYNQKRYVGVTSGTLKTRRKRHEGAASRGTEGCRLLNLAIRKYGADSFVWDVIEELDSYDEALAREVYWIKELKPEYNIHPGGQGYVGPKKITEEERIARSTRLREIMKTPEYKENWRKSMESVWPSMRGRAKHGKETRKVMSEKASNPKNVERMRNLDGWKELQKSVVCLDDGKTFPSASAAARHYGFQKSEVIETAGRHPRRATCGGLVFRYLGDHQGGLDEANEVRARAKENHRRSVVEKCAKPVRCITNDTIYESASSAARALGLYSAEVSSVAIGRRNIARGYVFQYIEQLERKET